MVVLRLLLITLMSVFLYGYVDSDLDGVDDSVDKCPNTPFSDLVNESGCSIKSLVKKSDSNTTKKSSKKIVIRDRVHKKRKLKRVKPKAIETIEVIDNTLPNIEPKRKKEVKSHYDISVGFDKFGSSSIKENVSMNYYRGDFSLSYFTTFDFKREYSDSRFNDTKLWGYYRYRYNKNLNIKVGAGVMMPHLEGESSKRVDGGLSLFSSYNKDGFNPFFGLSYRFNGLNGDYEGLKDNYSIYGGLGFYLSKRLYSSFTYSYSSKEYDWSKDIKTSTIYFYYDIDGHWFSNASFMKREKGLDYKHGFSLSIGYYF